MSTSGRRPGVIALVGVGLAAGLLSGLFGIGGGTIIVPALALWLGMPHRISAGTSVAAVLPVAVVGAISYAVQGNVDWVAAIALAIGITVGAPLGSRLLAKLPLGVIQWGFILFMACITVSLWIVIPQRDAQIDDGPLTIALLVFTGFAIGVISGPLGVGGGVILVPVLMLFFGSNDLDARGSSLLMMVPGSLMATFANMRRQNVDLRAALIVGLTASACVPFSSILATLLTPFWGNVLFSLYLLFIISQMAIRALRKPK